jgi:magnesium transporter
MIRLIDLRDNSEHIANPNELQTQTKNNVWYELVDPTANELQAVADETGVPKRLLELPQAEETINLRLEDGLAIINFVVPQEVAAVREADPIVMAFSKDFLVTVERKTESKVIVTAKERMSKTKIDPPAMVTYFIIDEIVSSHFVHLENLEHLTEQIEEDVVEKTAPDTLKKIFNLKSRLINYNKMLWYERGLVFNLKTCGDSCMPAKSRDLFNTTHEDLTRQIDIVETYREILSDAINVHLSAVSNKINFSIKSLTIVIFYLTIVTTVTSFPNTVATFFGISQFGGTNIIVIVVAIILSTALPLVWLWRRKWLKLKEAD